MKLVLNFIKFNTNSTLFTYINLIINIYFYTPKLELSLIVSLIVIIILFLLIEYELDVTV